MRQTWALAEAAIGLVCGLGELVDHVCELLEALCLAVSAPGVAGVDALEDDRQLPVAECDIEVDLREVAAGGLGVALLDLLAALETRGRGGGLEQRRELVARLGPVDDQHAHVC